MIGLFSTFFVSHIYKSLEVISATFCDFENMKICYERFCFVSEIENDFVSIVPFWVPDPILRGFAIFNLSMEWFVSIDIWTEGSRREVTIGTWLIGPNWGQKWGMVEMSSNFDWRVLWVKLKVFFRFGVEVPFFEFKEGIARMS